MVDVYKFMSNHPALPAQAGFKEKRHFIRARKWMCTEETSKYYLLVDERAYT